MGKQMQLTHLQREVKTAVELALAQFAPSDLLDQLAVVAGLLDAFTSLDVDDVTAHPLLAPTTERAKVALAAWHRWEASRPKPTA
jgi:hypothetical protein